MTRAYLASLYGATGRDKQARQLWRELLEINLGFSVERLRAVLPYKDPPWFGALRRRLAPRQDRDRRGVRCL